MRRSLSRQVAALVRVRVDVARLPRVGPARLDQPRVDRTSPSPAVGQCGTTPRCPGLNASARSAFPRCGPFSARLAEPRRQSARTQTDAFTRLLHRLSRTQLHGRTPPGRLSSTSPASAPLPQRPSRRSPSATSAALVVSRLLQFRRQLVVVAHALRRSATPLARSPSALPRAAEPTPARSAISRAASASRSRASLLTRRASEADLPAAAFAWLVVSDSPALRSALHVELSPARDWFTSQPPAVGLGRQRS